MPCDYKRDYPPRWKTEIRPRILARAENACEWEGCRARDRELVMRPATDPERWQPWDPMTFELDERELGGRVVEVVLTIAHLCDDGPGCGKESHLAALCQLHHNRLDMPMRQRHAAETRRRRRVDAGQLELVTA